MLKENWAAFYILYCQYCVILNARFVYYAINIIKIMNSVCNDSKAF